MEESSNKWRNIISRQTVVPSHLVKYVILLILFDWGAPGMGLCVLYKKIKKEKRKMKGRKNEKTKTLICCFRLWNTCQIVALQET